MVGRQWVAVVFLLLLPFASAYTIDGAEMTWQGYTITTLGAGKTLTGVATRITLSSDFEACFNGTGTCALLIQSPALGYDNLRLEVRNGCARTNGTIACTLPASTVSSGNTSLRYYSQVGDVRNPWTEFSIPLTIDDTIPKVASIKTGYCEGETCYVATGVPTPYEITMEDPVTSYLFKLVFVGPSGHGAQVASCEGNVCRGEVLIPCTDGEQVLLDVQALNGVSSREDSQNEITRGAVTVVCAGKAPEILSWKEEADGLVGLAVQGGNIVVTASVRTSVGTPTGTLNGSIVNGSVDASCTPDGDKYTCVWTLSSILAGTHDLEFYVYDAVGNYRTKEARITVLNLGMPPGNTSLDLFQGKVGKVTPEYLNRMALDVAAANNMPWPSYITYTFDRKSTSARIVKQELTSCTYKLPSERNYTSEYNLFALGASSGNRGETHVLYEDADWNATNRIDAQIRADRDVLALSDTFNVRCTVSLYVVDGTTLYNVPEEEVLGFTMKLRGTTLGEPGAEIVKKISETEDKLTSSTAKKIRKLEKWRQTADKVCSGVEKVVQIQNTGVIVMGIADSTCWLAGVGTVIKPIGNTIFSFTDTLLEPAWNGMLPEGGPVAQAMNRIQKSTEIAAFFGIIPDNNALLGNGGWLRKICRQVNCRVTADLNTAYPGKKIDPKTSAAQQAERNEIGTDLESKGKLPSYYSRDANGNYQLDMAKLGTTPKTQEPGSSGVFKNYAGSTKGEKFKNYAKEEILENKNTVDPMRSLSGSLTTMCLGGVVYNLQKYQTVECSYLQCLKEQSLRGGSVAVCDNVRRYQLCMNVVGEAMELPFVSTVKNIMGNVNHAVATAPNFIAKFFLNEVCNPSALGSVNTAQRSTCGNIQATACALGGSVVNAIDAAKQTKQALGGLRDPEGAEQALKICEQALKNETPVSSTIYGTEGQKTLEYGAWLRDVQAKSTTTPENQALGAVDALYRAANPNTEAPAYYRLGSTSTVQGSDTSVQNVNAYRANGDPITGTVPVEIKTVTSKTITGGTVTTTSVTADVASTNRLAGLKASGSKILKVFSTQAAQQVIGGQQPTAPQAADATRQVVKDAEKSGATTTKKATIEVSSDGLETAFKSGGDADFRTKTRLFAIRNGIMPASDSEAYNYYVYKTYYTAKRENWPELPAIEAAVTQNQADLAKLTKELNAIREQRADIFGNGFENGDTGAWSTEGGTETPATSTPAEQKAPATEPNKDAAIEITTTAGDKTVTSAQLQQMQSQVNEYRSLGTNLFNLQNILQQDGVKTVKINQRDNTYTITGYDSSGKQVQLGPGAKALIQSLVEKNMLGAGEVDINIALKNAMMTNNERINDLSDKIVHAPEPTYTDEELRQMQTQIKSYRDFGKNMYDLKEIFRQDNVATIQIELNPSGQHTVTAYSSTGAQIQIGPGAQALISSMARQGLIAYESGKRITVDAVFEESMDANDKRIAVLSERIIDKPSSVAEAQRTATVAIQNQQKVAEATANAKSGNDPNNDALRRILQDAGITGDQLEEFVRDPAKAEKYFADKQAEAQKALDAKKAEQEKAYGDLKTIAQDDVQRGLYLQDALEQLGAEQGLIINREIKDPADRKAIIDGICQVIECPASPDVGPVTMSPEDYEKAVIELAKAENAKVKGMYAQGMTDAERRAYVENTQAYMQAVSVVTDYGVKWYIDHNREQWEKLLKWYEDTPVEELVKITDVPALADNLCSDKYDIRDNDDGAVYQVAGSNVNLLATFGSEVREMENGTYAYITVAHVANPQGSKRNYELKIIFKGVDKCAVRPCKEEYSLTNDQAFNLSEGASFAQGQFARTRIEYLGAKYKEVCLVFDRDFPDDKGKKEYCRSIKEDTLSGDTVVPPTPTAQATSTGGGTATSAVEGWS